MNKNYVQGRNFEYEVVKIFKDKGFTAIRTAGSHSPYDVILVKHTPTLKKVANVCFIQCKTNIIKKGGKDEDDKIK